MSNKLKLQEKKSSSGRTSAYNVDLADKGLNGGLGDTHLFLTAPDLCNEHDACELFGSKLREIPPLFPLKNAINSLTQGYNWSVCATEVETAWHMDGF